jgi:hypothetical protein
MEKPTELVNRFLLLCIGTGIYLKSTLAKLFHNSKNHAIEERWMTASEFEEDVKKNEEKYRSLIKKT